MQSIKVISGEMQNSDHIVKLQNKNVLPSSSSRDHEKQDASHN